MAKVLNELQRNIVTEALQSLVDQLDRVDSTGNPVVDRLVSDRREAAAELAELAGDAHRISISTTEEGTE